MAVCIAELVSEMACCNWEDGTRPGSREVVAGLSKARAAPTAATTTKTSQVGVWPARAVAARVRPARASASWQARMMWRRSYWSAIWPAGRVRIICGTNWARPTMPRAKVLPVSA